MTVDLSAAEARRLGLAAQGFARAIPAKPSVRHVRAVAKRLHAIQLDSVNVLARAHYLPVYSRIGPYPQAWLDTTVNARHELIELDAHQASLVPVELEPLLRVRRQRWKNAADWRARMEERRPGFLEAVERTVVERGPVSLKDLEDRGRRAKVKADDLHVRRRDGKPYAESSVLWWRPSDGKDALDGLLMDGRLALAGRGPGFERLYDLTERVIPPDVLARPAPSAADATRALVRLASEALGVATPADLANYFGLKVNAVRAVARDLQDNGVLLPAHVEGWKGPAFLSPTARMPSAIDARALLGPFDPLTWSRDRTRRLFGFDFSFEIYVPAAKRRFGYYVLPFLLGDALVARVDLKANRRRGVLQVPGAFAEPAGDVGTVVLELADALRGMASWLGLQGIEIGDRGDLVRPLTRALKPGRGS